MALLSRGTRIAIAESLLGIRGFVSFHLTQEARASWHLSRFGVALSSFFPSNQDFSFDVVDTGWKQNQTTFEPTGEVSGIAKKSKPATYPDAFTVWRYSARRKSRTGSTKKILHCVLNAELTP